MSSVVNSVRRASASETIWIVFDAFSGCLVVKMTSEKETAEVLITEIQARPVLWNTKLASYKNKNLRDRLYAEVAEILGLSSKYVK